MVLADHRGKLLFCIPIDDREGRDNHDNDSCDQRSVSCHVPWGYGLQYYCRDELKIAGLMQQERLSSFYWYSGSLFMLCIRDGNEQVYILIGLFIPASKTGVLSWGITPGVPVLLAGKGKTSRQVGGRVKFFMQGHVI